MSTDTTSPEFFEGKYRADGDPWNFGSSTYEQNRYQAIIDAIPAREYRNAFEPGCSIGVLTRRLASISAHVDAMDISPTAAQRTREYCSDLANVTVMCGALPNNMPVASYDLLVFSEIGYYFTELQLFDLIKTLIQRLDTPGILLAAHWLGTSEDHILSGDKVHEILASAASSDGLHQEHSEKHANFRLERWAKS